MKEGMVATLQQEVEVASYRQEVSALIASLPQVVTTVAEYEAAGSRLRDVKQRSSDLDKLRKSMTRPMDDAKARVMELFRPILGELSSAETILKARMIGFQEREDARVRAEQVLIEQERAAVEALAGQAAESGDYEQAMALQDERSALRDAAPGYAKDESGYRPAVGTSTTVRWHAEVVDVAALVLAVAMGEAPLGLLEPNQQALDALARATKAESTLPGVQFVGRRVLAATGRA